MLLHYIDRFLGDQRASYNQDLSFTLRIGEAGPAPIFGQNNHLPSVTVTKNLI